MKKVIFLGSKLLCAGRRLTGLQTDYLSCNKNDNK